MENDWIVQNKKFLELANQFSVEASDHGVSTADVGYLLELPWIFTFLFKPEIRLFKHLQYCLNLDRTRL